MKTDIESKKGLFNSTSLVSRLLFVSNTHYEDKKHGTSISDDAEMSRSSAVFPDPETSTRNSVSDRRSSVQTGTKVREKTTDSSIRPSIIQYFSFCFFEKTERPRSIVRKPARARNICLKDAFYSQSTFHENVHEKKTTYFYSLVLKLLSAR